MILWRRSRKRLTGNSGGITSTTAVRRISAAYWSSPSASAGSGRSGSTGGVVATASIGPPMSSFFGGIRYYDHVCRVLGPRRQCRRVRFEEPSASTCTLGSVREAVTVGYGEPKRARCRKRRIQPRGYLRPRLVLSYSEDRVPGRHGPFRDDSRRARDDPSHR